MTKIAKNISVNIDNKTIEWTGRRDGARYSTELQTVRLFAMGPEQLKIMPRLAHWTDNDDSYNLHSELLAYLEKPRKSLGDRSYSSILLEKGASERALKAKAAEIEARLDQEAPFLDAAMAALEFGDVRTVGVEVQNASAGISIEEIKRRKAYADMVMAEVKAAELLDRDRQAKTAEFDERLDSYMQSWSLLQMLVRQGRHREPVFDEQLEYVVQSRLAIRKLFAEVAA